MAQVVMIPALMFGALALAFFALHGATKPQAFTVEAGVCLYGDRDVCYAGPRAFLAEVETMAQGLPTAPRIEPAAPGTVYRNSATLALLRARAAQGDLFMMIRADLVPEFMATARGSLLPGESIETLPAGSTVTVRGA